MNSLSDWYPEVLKKWECSRQTTGPAPLQQEGKTLFCPNTFGAQTGPKCPLPAPLSSWSLPTLSLWRTIKSKMLFSAHVFGGESTLWRQLFLFTLQHFIFPTSCNYSHFLITAGSGCAFSEVHTDSKPIIIIIIIISWYFPDKMTFAGNEVVDHW